MDFWQKVEHFEKDMRAHGGKWGARNAIPPLLRLAWKLGIKTPPPYFQGFWRLTIGMGAFFAVAWGLFMWFVIWRKAGVSPLAVAPIAAVAGAAFGSVMAGLTRRKARTLGLPPWEEYPGTRNSVDAQDA